MRGVALLATVVVLGCASIGAPPGGPARTTPPELVEIRPESGAVNVSARSVNFVFDAVISDRAELDRLFMLSPQDGKPRVSWKRERIEVRPRRGFRPNTAYTVTMLPGLSDLRGNAIKTGRTIIFSTGPTIPPYSVFGRVFDWLNERVAPRALVEVVRRPDSLLYIGIADSAGQFGVGPLAEGTYTVRAIMDNNNNRVLDAQEPWDSVGIVVGGGTSPFLELLAAPRDTVPPRILTLSSNDSVTLSVTFDKPLDPARPIGTNGVRVISADSVPVPVQTVLTRAEADRMRAARDSAAATARDTSRRVTDTTRAAGVTPPRRDTAAAGGPVVVPPPKPSRRPPARELVLQLTAPLQPGKGYRVSVIGAKGLLGPPRTTERVIVIPRARADSTRNAPPPPPPRRPPS